MKTYLIRSVEGLYKTVQAPTIEDAAYNGIVCAQAISTKDRLLVKLFETDFDYSKLALLC